MVRFTSVEFQNYKAFSSYSISLEKANIIIGPNNCGKSTLISAFRILDVALRHAKSRNAQRYFLLNDFKYAYKISTNSLPVSTENVAHEYNENDALIIFNLSNFYKLTLIFPNSGGCFLLAEADGKYIRTINKFNHYFPINICVVPVLGHVEHEEELVKEKTVKSNLNTQRASRNFRSYWYYFNDGFDAFSKLVRSTWDDSDIELPTIVDKIKNTLAMFCYEGRMPRELFWSGSGFQIWCQLLTHLSRAENSNLLIVDEPEIYMHPDLQRKFLTLLSNTGLNYLMATHSSEIISEAEYSDILLIDKFKKNANRLEKFEQVQLVLNAIGSLQNVLLSNIARHKKLIFVENNYDYKILKEFSSKFDFNNIKNCANISIVPTGGFSYWKKFEPICDFFSKVAKERIEIFVIFDRDYWCNDEISDILKELRKASRNTYILNRKEIENYLIIPTAMCRAMNKMLTSGNNVNDKVILNMLSKITDKYKDDCQRQYLSKRVDYYKKRTPKDTNTIMKEGAEWFNSKWSNVNTRIELIPGKAVLSEMRMNIQNIYKVTLTEAKIIQAMDNMDLPSDLRIMLSNLNKFVSQHHGLQFK